MPTRFDPEFWVRMMIWEAMIGWGLARFADQIELRKIEQATVDAEFWEIVNAG